MVTYDYNGWVTSKPQLRDGEPCSIGCEHHLSHPCENCGRYAAGNRDRPDIDILLLRIRSLGNYDPIIHKYLNLKYDLRWTDKEMLGAMVLWFQEENTKLIEALYEIKMKTGM